MRASYRNGIDFIAMNDEPTEYEAEVVASQISTMLLAELFGKTRLEVANDILRYRDNHGVYGGDTHTALKRRAEQD